MNIIQYYFALVASCPPVPYVENSKSISLNASLFVGSKLTITCKDGYQISSGDMKNQVFHCTKDNFGRVIWEDMPQDCTLLYCKKYNTPLKSQITAEFEGFQDGNPIVGI